LVERVGMLIPLVEIADKMDRTGPFIGGQAKGYLRDITAILLDEAFGDHRISSTQRIIGGPSFDR
ncbi:MAG: hypothetical protein KDE31_06400, partial [Caldilineaceae bacterium]|nr:hypothetical protein [Caldilineaceae bacterium]